MGSSESPSEQTILVTGGAGYIGSHTVIELLKTGRDVIVVDNFSNSSPEVLNRIKQLSDKKIVYYEDDVADKNALRAIFNSHTINAVMHFAGLKSVNESVTSPLHYYRNNIDTTLSLCEVMQENGVKKLIFSSSATVYGDPEDLPLREEAPVGRDLPSPYGKTKFTIEQMLGDLVMSDHSWQITSLRYFNPIGAHASGLIGEDPQDTPANIMPYISQVAVGRLPFLKVFGGTYNTPDGTCIRDYIHVVDLARGHIAALGHLGPTDEMKIYNLGTGKGVSVLELIHAFEEASSVKIPYEIVGARSGDVVASYADVAKADKELGWHARESLVDACRTSWQWQSLNPNGYVR